ncbi:MAG: hypothetical protein Q4G08_07245 [Capnocytophaga sp.]|nr:hypothetical protein [Capnocytophaga sp.]
MKMDKWYYMSIVAGVLVALSRYFAPSEYGQLLLVGGMALIMVGIYSISKNLSSKRKEDFEPPLVVTEETNEPDKTDENDKKS